MPWPSLRMFRGGRELALQQPSPAPARQEPRLISKRRFEGAKIDRTTLDWRFDHNALDTDLRQGLRILRGRMRALEQNNDYAKGWLKLIRRNVIGPNGIRLINAAVNPDRSLDDNANQRIEDGWQLWSRKGTCTADGKQSLLEASWTWITSVARDGEGLIRLLPGFANEFGFAVQFLEADYLDEHFHRDLPNGGRIRMGVEMDQWGRPVAYHLFTRHPGEYGWNPGLGRVRVPADQILHGFITERFGQTRGLPWGHAAMRRLHMLGKYEEYALIAARVGAAKGGFFEQTDPAAGDPWTQAAGEEKTEQGDMVRDVEPGSFEALPPGWTLKEWKPDYPRGEMPGFNKMMLRAVSTGLGVAYEGIANDRENVNYSSIRAGLLDERDEWRLLQAWTAIHFHQPIYDAWLPLALLSGAITLPFTKLEKFAKPIWRGRGWAWVDPAKEIDAYTRAVALGVMSRTQIAALEGKDIEDVFRELVSEKSLAQKMGLIIIDPIPAGRPSAPPAAEENPAPTDTPDNSGDAGAEAEPTD
jgi:lambda family phage portal protein